MELRPIIRLVKSADFAAVLEIYKPFVTSTGITPEDEVPGLQEFSIKIDGLANNYPFLISEVNGKVTGYTFANNFRAAQGHKWSVEVSIYLSKDYYGKGVAAALYQSLFAILKLQNYINVFAGIVLPNQRSEVFHKNLGFQEVGTFKKGVYKLGNWHDVRWFQLNLTENCENPPFPKPVKEIIHTTEFETILKQANEGLIFQ